MSACDEFERLLDGAIDDPSKLARLRQPSPHVASCPRCSRSLELALQLASLKENIVIPLPALEDRRSRVLASVSRMDHRLRDAGSSRPRRLVLALLQACAAGFVGYLAGAARWPFRPAPDPGRQIVGILARAARRPDPAEGALASPYVLTDVRVLDSDEEHVEISGIAGQEVRLRLDRRDPLIEREVVQAWLARGSLYQRIEAASLADTRGSTPVRVALLAAMEHDPSPVVRLAVADRLAPLRGDRATVESFLRVLRSDPNVAMKLAAVDFLIRNEIAPATLRAAVEAADPASSGPALLRARRYLSSIAD